MNNQWSKSALPETQGCIMIRPVVGSKSIVGIIPEITKSIVCTIFPNPASDFVTIDISSREMDQACHLSVYDITGKMVFTETIDNTVIDVSGFAKGLYIFKISDDDGAFVMEKVLISH